MPCHFTREVAIRSAVGATRARIVRQLLTESVILSMLGGAGGLLLASLVTDALAPHAPNAAHLPGLDRIGVDHWVSSPRTAHAVTAHVANPRTHQPPGVRRRDRPACGWPARSAARERNARFPFYARWSVVAVGREPFSRRGRSDEYHNDRPGAQPNPHRRAPRPIPPSGGVVEQRINPHYAPVHARRPCLVREVQNMPALVALKSTNSTSRPAREREYHNRVG